MTKWADYLISAVSFNYAHTHIDKVRAHVDNGDSVGTAKDYDRQTVVSAIEKGTTFMTIFKGTDGQWKKGMAVFIVPIGGVKYIKTVADNTKVDNLDNLPEF
jgi:Protein of unknown function (DUF3892)